MGEPTDEQLGHLCGCTIMGARMVPGERDPQARDVQLLVADADGAERAIRFTGRALAPPKRTARRVWVARGLSLLLVVCLLLAIWVGDGRWFATSLLVAVALSVACAPQWAETKAEVEAQRAAKASGS